MDQVNSSKWFPAWGSSASWTWYFFRRATQGSGSFSSSGMPSTLVFTFPTGCDTPGLLVSTIKAAVVQHLLNCGIQALWSPKMGTVREALELALECLAGPPLTQGAQSTNLYFDGEFGPVYVA